MATPEETIDTIISNAIGIADEHTAKAEHYADYAVDLIAGSPVVVSPYPWDKEIEAVEPDIATVDSALRTYETQRDELIAILSGQLGDFFTTYYPLVNDAYDVATAWLVNTITNGGTGIPAYVEDQIWQRGRDRLITEGRRMEDQSVAGIAARGFSMPPGVLNKTIKELRVAQHAAMGEMSTSVAVEQAKIEIDNIKFAVGKAIDARLTAMGAAADYIRALAIAPETATRLADVDPSAQARMISATSDLYRARLSRDQLVMNTEIAKMGTYQSDQKLFHDVGLGKKREAVNAVVSAANVFGKTSQAALSSLNSVASLGSTSFA